LYHFILIVLVIFQLYHKVRHHRDKLDWLKPKTPPTEKKINAIGLITSNVGFKAKLNKIRANKLLAQKQKSPEKQKTPSPPPTPDDICALITHFKTLPKIYPSKPKKPKPKPTEVMIERYKERKKQRETAMNTGTKRRIRRVEHHLQSLKEIYLRS